MKNKKREDLDKLLNPKKIAIIGASPKKEKVGNILIRKLSKFNGKLFFINPNYEKILNKKSFKSIKDCKENIDLVIIAIPAKKINNIIKECGEKKIKNIIIISSGFSEIGNKELEKNLLKTAQKYNINLLGPNCFGIINTHLNLNATFSKESPNKGSIAFISQSGALGSYIFDMNDKKYSLSKFISLGNMADIGFSDIIKILNKDKNTKSIILYIEKIKNGKEFIDICKKSKKEIIVIKTGKSKKASKAAISHTGSIATDFNIYKGAFKQAGIKTAKNLESAFDYLNIKPKPKGNKILILTNAGGAGALMTDYCIENNLNVIKQPIDILGTAKSQDYKKELNQIKKSNKYDLLIIILTPQEMSEPEKTAKEIIKISKKKPVITCFLGEKSIKKSEKILKENNIPFFNNLEKCAQAIGVFN